MACTISKGRLDAFCKDNVGGIKNIIIYNFVSAISEATAGTALETALDAETGFKFELQGTGNSFEETGESSRDNGTSFFNQTLTVSLKTQDTDTHAQLDALSKGRPHVVIEDYNGTFRLAGHEYGLDVVVTTTTGAAMGDLNGYNLTFSGQERGLAPFLTDAPSTLDASPIDPNV